MPTRLVGNASTGLGVHSPQLSRAAEQYQHNRGWVYVAVKTIAAKIAGQPICVGRVSSTPQPGRKVHLPGSFKSLDLLVEPLADHALLRAIQNPNPLQVQWSLIYSTVASILITGRALWWFTEEDGVTQIWILPSHWCEPVDSVRTGWKVRPPGYADSFHIPAEDAALFNLPDPSNPFGMGLSPLQSQAMAIDADEQILSSQAASFRNGIHPTYAIRVGRLPGMMPGDPGDKIVLEPEQRIELITTLKQMHTGTSRTGEPLILDGLIEGVDKISNTNDEMDYLNSGGMVKSRILQAFGLNPIIAGEIENANRASAAVAGQLFCEHTVGPLVELISQTLTRFANRGFASPKEKLLAWIEECRANDPEQRLAEWRVALASQACTVNEYRQAVLGLPGVTGGDVIRDPMGNVVE